MTRIGATGLLGGAGLMLLVACGGGEAEETGDASIQSDVDALHDEDTAPDAQADTHEGADTEEAADAVEDTAGAEDADTGPRDTAGEEVAPPDVGEDADEADTSAPPAPCDSAGALEPCTATCEPGEIPLRSCAGGVWGECSCVALSHQRLAVLGAGVRAGFAGTPEGDLYACYTIGVNLAVAYRFSPTPPNNWDIQLVGDAAVECDLALGVGERVHMVYGVIDGEARRGLVYRTIHGGDVSAAEPILAGNPDDGHHPRIAVSSDGAVHAFAGAVLLGDEFVVRAYQRASAGSWVMRELAEVPTTTFANALAVCDDGTPVVAYGAEHGDQSWSAWVAARDAEGVWSIAPLSAGVAAAIGPGPSLACSAGSVHGVFQDAATASLISFHSGTPQDPASYVAGPIVTAFDVGIRTDLRAHGDWLYLSLAATHGDVHLAVRPRDLSAPWQIHTVARSADIAGGEWTGDVRLYVAPDGRPHILYFGQGDDAEGPWVATIP